MKTSKNRDDFLWKEFYNDYKSYLRKTYRGIGPDGEALTEDWYDEESKKMADLRYSEAIERIKMRMRQREMEQKAKANDPTVVSQYTKDKLAKQLADGNPYAEWALETITEKEKKDKK